MPKPEHPQRPDSASGHVSVAREGNLSPLLSAAADAELVTTRIELRSFTVRAGGRDLLRHSSIDFPAGKVTLLLGCSGVGKSVLLRILAGLIESEKNAIQFEGTAEFQSSDGASRGIGADGHPVAVVFQSFALLDELTPLQNVQIAVDHSSRSGPERQTLAAGLLSELQVPTDRPTAVLSGGQRQRLAIARALAMQSDVIFYDEPTSGLDVNTAVQVADLIRKTQQSHQRTSVIVTHDDEAFQRIADHIIVLDHHHHKLIEVPRSDWGRLADILGEPLTVRTDSRATVPAWPLRLRSAIVRSLEGTGRFAEESLLLPWSLLPLWKSIPWGLRLTWHYLKLVAGWSACLYISVAGMIIGFVAQDFIFRYLPYRQITEPLLTENLLHATGFSLYRFLVPILATILIAARSGAAVAADIGSKVYGNQIDALRTIGINPLRSLRTPILYAFLIGTPLLSFLSYMVAAVTAAFAFLLTHPDPGIAFWDSHFHQYLIPPQGFFYKGSDWLIAKLLTCGAGIAMISWRCGISPKQSGPEISRGVTQTILWSTLFALMVHFLFSLLEFKAQGT